MSVNGYSLNGLLDQVDYCLSVQAVPEPSTGLCRVAAIGRHGGFLPPDLLAGTCRPWRRPGPFPGSCPSVSSLGHGCFARSLGPPSTIIQSVMIHMEPEKSKSRKRWIHVQLDPRVKQGPLLVAAAPLSLLGWRCGGTADMPFVHLWMDRWLDSCWASNEDRYVQCITYFAGRIWSKAAKEIASIVDLPSTQTCPPRPSFSTASFWPPLNKPETGGATR